MELFNKNTSVHTPNNCRIVHLVRVLCPWQAVTTVLYKHCRDVPNTWCCHIQWQRWDAMIRAVVYDVSIETGWFHASHRQTARRRNDLYDKMVDGGCEKFIGTAKPILESLSMQWCELANFWWTKNRNRTVYQNDLEKEPVRKKIYVYYFFLATERNSYRRCVGEVGGIVTISAKSGQK